MTRRVLCCITLAILISPALARGQRIEVTPLVGFGSVGIAEDEQVHYDPARGPGYQSQHGPGNFFDGVSFDEDPSFGLLVGIGVSRHTQIEFFYRRQQATVDDSRFDLYNRAMDLQYFHVGAIYQWTLKQVQPFAGGSIGTTRMSLPGDSESSFSFGPTAGLKVPLNDRVAFRFAGRLLLSAIEESGPLGCPTGDCPGRQGEEALVDLEISVGLTFHFGQPRG